MYSKLAVLSKLPKNSIFYPSPTDVLKARCFILTTNFLFKPQIFCLNQANVLKLAVLFKLPKTRCIIQIQLMYSKLAVLFKTQIFYLNPRCFI